MNAKAKIILLSLLAAAGLLLRGNAGITAIDSQTQAVTMQDATNQIQQIQQQISNLTAQVAQMQGQAAPVVSPRAPLTQAQLEAIQAQVNSIAAQTARITIEVQAIEDLEGLIQEPGGWTMRHGTISSRPLVAYFKPVPEKDAAGKTVPFNENISIIRESIKSAGVTTGAKYIAKSKSALQLTIKGYQFTAEKKVNLSDGTEATLIGGSFTQNGVALKNMQLFAFNGGDAYVVTGVVLAANWEKEKDMVGAAIMSFRFPQEL